MYKTLALSSAKSHIHPPSLGLELAISLPSNNGPPCLSCGNNDRKGPDLVLLAVHSHTPRPSRTPPSLSLAGSGQRVFGIIPSWMKGSERLRGSNEWRLQCIWYYAMQWTGSLSGALMYFWAQTERARAGTCCRGAEPRLKRQVGHFDVWQRLCPRWRFHI